MSYTLGNPVIHISQGATWELCFEMRYFTFVSSFHFRFKELSPYLPESTLAV